jgi:tetratricopeptide (TPR) repeat protein
MPALLADLVHQHTGGNPFFAEALLDLLREQGHLSMATDPAQGRPRCVLHGDITRAIRELPATVRGLVLARLDQLPYDTRITLQVAAVIGQNFAVTILYDVLHAFTMISPAALQRHLADLLARDITQQMPAQEQGYRFRHAIFQEAAYQTLLYAWRHDLHRAVARWYEQHYDDSAHLDALTLTVLAPRALQTPLAPYYPRLVHHYHHAEDQEQERRYAGLAGLWTAARYANAEAVQHLSRALDLTPGSTYDERYALLLAREQVFNRQGRRTEQAHDLAALETLGAHLNDSERRAEVALRHAHYGTVTGDYTAAIIAAQEALDLNLARVRQIAFNHYLPELAPPAMRPTGADERPDLRPALSSAVQVTTTAYLRLSRALWAQGNYAAARQQLEQAQVLAQGAGLQAIQAESLLQLGKIAYYESNYTVARSCGEHALALYQAQEDRQGAAQALTHLANVMNDQAEYALACDYFDKVLAIHREMGDRYHEGVVLSNLAETYREQGDYATAQAMYQTVLDLCRAIKDMQGEGVVLLSLGIAHSEQGKYTQAASYINQAQPIFHALDDQYNLAMVMDSLGLLSQYQGDYPQAAACYQQAHTIRQAIGDQQGSGRMYALLGLVAYYMGALDQAGAACRAAVEIAQAHDYAFEQANALLYLGHVQTAQGALEEAHDTYQQALIILHKNEQTTQVCEAQAGLARLALAQGYLDAAQAHTEAILTHLDTAPDLPGTDEPLRVYLTCYEVLRAAQDARAPALLRAACTLLRERAALIEDARLRQSFLENVAAHRALLRAEQREAAGPVAE